MTPSARFAVVFGGPLALGFCGGDRFVSGTDPSSAGSTSAPSAGAGRADAGTAGAAAGRTDALGGAFFGSGGASSGEGGASDAAEPLTVPIPIQNDADDAVFVRGEDEQLQYDMRVGTAESWRIGLIFPVSIPKGSRIERATLLLTRVGGDAVPEDGLRVEVYESSNVPSFDDTHMHRPEAHVSEGLWSKSVGGFRVGSEGQVESPDLSVLLEHVLSRADYKGTGRIGFILSSERMPRVAIFADSYAVKTATALRVSYVPPR